jgi:hypothetical protein
MSAARSFTCSKLLSEGKVLYQENHSQIQRRMIRFSSSRMTSLFGFLSSLYRKIARVLVAISHRRIFPFFTQIKRLLEKLALR